MVLQNPRGKAKVFNHRWTLINTDKAGRRGKKKKPGHYSGLLSTTLKLFIEAARPQQE